MTQYNSFNHKNSKLNQLYSTVQKQKAQVPELTKTNPVEHSVTYLKKNQKIEVPTVPQYYDMYNWLGVTYSSGDAPEPASAYEAGYRGYYWRYPVFDFRVPKGSTPLAEVPGTLEEQWEYSRSIAIVQSSVFVNNLTDKLLNYMAVKSFLYNENNEPVSCDDFSEIYRWHKETNGYTFYYNAYYGIEQEETQILIKAELILMNPDNYDALYKIKVI